MGRRILIGAAALIVLSLIVAMIMQVVSHRMWERRVWACFSALGSGERRVSDRLLVPPVCTPDAILVSNIGLPNAEVILAFKPPRTMWWSYAMRTVEYDSYSIELSRREGGTRAQLHHGSD